MKFLTETSEIAKILCSLMNRYKIIQFASAWASNNSKVFDTLIKHTNKITKTTVGIHFYQTHPKFIEEFIDSDRIKFKEQPNGTFHPKIYLFSNNKEEWECLIGSANFTRAAMDNNTEVMLHIGWKDLNASEVYDQIISELNDYWEEAKTFTNDDLNRYQTVWNKKIKLINHLEDRFGDNPVGNPMYLSNIMSLSWDDFYQQVAHDKNHSFQIRLKLLEKSQSYFCKNKYENMGKVERQQIAGIVKNDLDDSTLNWMYFGHMTSPRFKNRISDESKNISDALEYIPLQGIITKDHYMRYIDYFKSNDNYGYGVTTISRFLAMKRPDIFFCITGANSQKLYKDFGIKEIGRKEYERYWDEITGRIMQSEWWNSNKPLDLIEQNVWNNRAAMLDAILYSGNLQ
jgi:HKD family nuclease